MSDIILIDRSPTDRVLQNVEMFLQQSYRIVVLIVEHTQELKACKEKYEDNPNVIHIISSYAFGATTNGTEWFSYQLLRDFKEAQCKIEFAAHRWCNNGMLATNHFINVLSWLNHIFDTYSIRFVFASELEHGYLHDLPCHIAKQRNIPAFFTSHTIIYGTSLLFYNTNTYIALVGGHLSQTQLKENLFYSFEPNKMTKYKKHASLYKKIRQYARKCVLKIGGQLGVEFLMTILHGNYTAEQYLGYYPFSFWAKLQSYLYTKKQRRYYNSIAKTPNYDEKFIFYAMHFEPEGGTSVCVPLQNQLTIIQMLSRALPKGYKLYVKEHPHQFMLNNPEMSYFLYNIKWFKSIEFYKEVQKLENVEFITFDTPSKELIQKSIATATINGTIFLESTFLNKPCIVFGDYNLLLRTAKNAIYVNSFKSLKEGITNLINNPQDFDNSDELESYKAFLSKHTIHYQSPDRAKIFLDSIEAFLQQNYEEKQV